MHSLNLINWTHKDNTSPEAIAYAIVYRFVAASSVVGRLKLKATTLKDVEDIPEALSDALLDNLVDTIRDAMIEYASGQLQSQRGKK